MLFIEGNSVVDIQAYLIKRPMAKLGLDHYAALIVKDYAYGRRESFLIEKTPEGIMHGPFNNNTGWQTVSKADEQAQTHLIERLQSVVANAPYDVLVDNCEQFARYIVEGAAYSTQARAAGLLAGVAVVASFFGE